MILFLIIVKNWFFYYINTCAGTSERFFSSGRGKLSPYLSIWMVNVEIGFVIGPRTVLEGQRFVFLCILPVVELVNRCQSYWTQITRLNLCHPSSRHWISTMLTTLISIYQQLICSRSNLLGDLQFKFRYIIYFLCVFTFLNVTQLN